jgi:hypothetical protein
VPDNLDLFNRLGWRAVAIGGAIYLFLLPLSGAIPSATALVSALATLLIAGFWLVLYGAAAENDPRRAWFAIAILPALPLTTLVAGGFLGYGIYWVMSILAFYYIVARRRAWLLAAAPPAVFLGLSLFVTYMGQRSAIREAVWYEQTSLIDRLDRVSPLSPISSFSICRPQRIQWQSTSG